MYHSSLTLHTSNQVQAGSSPKGTGGEGRSYDGSALQRAVGVQLNNKLRRRAQAIRKPGLYALLILPRLTSRVVNAIIVAATQDNSQIYHSAS